jgi:hypothetical protein
VLDDPVSALSGEAFDGCGRLATFEAFETGVDSAPTRAHEIDEESEIVDAGVSLREKLSFDPLQAPDRLVQQASDLRDVARDGQYLRAEPVSHRHPDLSRNRGLESCGGRRERLDLLARAFERSLEQRRLRAAGGRVGDALLGSF